MDIREVRKRGLGESNWDRTPKDIVTLEPWEEISGLFFGLYEDDGWLYVECTDGAIRVRPDSAAAEYFRESLEDTDYRFVSIVKTDSIEQPYRVRDVSGTSE